MVHFTPWEIWRGIEAVRKLFASGPPLYRRVRGGHWENGQCSWGDDQHQLMTQKRSSVCWVYGNRGSRAEQHLTSSLVHLVLSFIFYTTSNALTSAFRSFSVFWIAFCSSVHNFLCTVYQKFFVVSETERTPFFTVIDHSQCFHVTVLAWLVCRLPCERCCNILKFPWYLYLSKVCRAFFGNDVDTKSIFIIEPIVKCDKLRLFNVYSYGCGRWF